MEAVEATSQAKVELPHRDTIQGGKEKVLGKFPGIRAVSKKEYKPRYKKGDEVYLTAFLKKEKSTFYMCRAVVEQAPKQGERQVYKARIVAIGDRPIGGKPVVKQAQLLGLVVTKSTKELHKDPPAFMCPPEWIEKDPGDTDRKNKLDTNGVVNVPREQSNRQASGSHKGGTNGKAKGKRQKANKKVPARGPSNSTSKAQ
jgi:hypothetical protein